MRRRDDLDDRMEEAKLRLAEAGQGMAEATQELQASVRELRHEPPTMLVEFTEGEGYAMICRLAHKPYNQNAYDRAAAKIRKAYAVESQPGGNFDG